MKFIVTGLIPAKAAAAVDTSTPRLVVSGADYLTAFFDCESDRKMWIRAKSTSEGMAETK